MIHLRNITKTYPMGKRSLQVLKGVDLDVAKGELLAIMGPSGSGKSTMLNLLGCLDKPTSGQYELDGREVSKLNGGELAEVRGRKIGFIFQTFNLLPRLTAVANVELGMRYVGGTDHKMALHALEQVGLGARVNHRPTELSGGEQQRVAIARALIKNPPLLLADEPTGNLDSASGADIIKMLTDLHAASGITLVMITHDPGVARACQRIVHVRDGLIVREEAV
jgi:putative ABC transport system ATP-binding protein